jgi:hypothetical protein
MRRETAVVLNPLTRCHSNSCSCIVSGTHRGGPATAFLHATQHPLTPFQDTHFTAHFTPFRFFDFATPFDLQASRGADDPAVLGALKAASGLAQAENPSLPC